MEPPGRNQCEDSQAGEILEVIGDERIPHGKQIEEAECRKKCSAEVEQGDQWPRHPPRSHGHHGGNREGADGDQPLQPGVTANLPARIHEGKIRGPDELKRVGPHGPPCDQEPFGRRPREDGSGRTDMHSLQPTRVPRKGGADQKEGDQGPNRPQRQPTVFPPGQEQQHRRQRTGHRLAQERRDEEREADRISQPITANFRIGHVSRRPDHNFDQRPQGEQVKQSRQHVLAFADPRNRLDMNRMQPERERSQPRPRHREAAQDQPDQNAIRRVECRIER